MKALLFSSALALGIGLPAGWILSTMLTPVLWRLKPILQMELAGHSGPTDWIFYLVWAIVVPALFLLFHSVIFRRSASRA